MESLQTLNPKSTVASNAQILFLVLNTSSVTLFPVTIMMYRAQQGAAYPADIFIPILLATSVSTVVGLVSVAVVQGIRLWDKVILAYLAAAFVIIGGVTVGFSYLDSQQMSLYSAAVGNGLMLLAIAGFLLLAVSKKVAVYDAFIEGAKGGFELAVKIMPYLVAMLVAIGLLRSSGVLGWFSRQVAALIHLMGGNTAFVDALPTALMRPFSASGARAMMLETMSTHGVDSFVARLSAIFQGSTETTFYVLAVYFGAVGIKRVRHAIACGLLADLGGLVAAVFIGYWFFAVQ